MMVMMAFGILALVIGDDGLLELLRGTATTIILPTAVLPSIGEFGECDGTPLATELQATTVNQAQRSPPTPCFGHLDGRALALQCRCRVLQVAGRQDLRD